MDLRAARAPAGDADRWLQIGTLREAVDAAVRSATPPDVLVVQGAEAGGHGRVADGSGFVTLLPEIADVLAAEGLETLLVAAGASWMGGGWWVRWVWGRRGRRWGRGSWRQGRRGSRGVIRMRWCGRRMGRGIRCGHSCGITCGDVWMAGAVVAKGDRQSELGGAAGGGV